MKRGEGKLCWLAICLKSPPLEGGSEGAAIDFIVNRASRRMGSGSARAPRVQQRSKGATGYLVSSVAVTQQ